MCHTAIDGWQGRSDVVSMSDTAGQSRTWIGAGSNTPIGPRGTNPICPPGSRRSRSAAQACRGQHHVRPHHDPPVAHPRGIDEDQSWPLRPMRGSRPIRPPPTPLRTPRDGEPRAPACPRSHYGSTHRQVAPRTGRVNRRGLFSDFVCHGRHERLRRQLSNPFRKETH